MILSHRQSVLSVATALAWLIAASSAHAQSCAGSGNGGDIGLGSADVHQCLFNQSNGVYNNIVAGNGTAINPSGFSAIANEGRIELIEVLRAATLGPYPNEMFINNRGLITKVLNHGTVEGSRFVVNEASANISYLVNNGEVRARVAVFNAGEIGNIDNYGRFLVQDGAILNQPGAMLGRIVNSGIIDVTAANGIGISNLSDIGVIQNSGHIGGNGVGIQNTGLIHRIGNTGTINAIENVGGRIIVMTNSGVIARFYNSGSIGSIANSGHITMEHVVPASYVIEIRSRADYGHLAFDNSRYALSGKMQFSLAAKMRNLEDGTYRDVLQNLPVSHLEAMSLKGRYGPHRWRLDDSDADNNWNLIIWTPTGPEPMNAANTLQMVQQSAEQVRGQINLKQAALSSILQYDSNVFGPNNVSISFLGRYTSLLSETSQGAGALVAAYRVAPTMRLGAFLDFAPFTASPTNIQQSGTQPTYGAFAVYEQNEDLVGWNGRASLGYGQNFLTIARNDYLEDTEPGRGKATLAGFGAAAELSYGVRLSQNLITLPYLGVRYTDVSRSSYTEWLGDYVTNPLSYRPYAQRLTTALLGLRFVGAFDAQFGYFAGAGLEYDLSQNMGLFSGTSQIDGLGTFSFATNSDANRLRAAGSVGLTYKPAANQKVTAEVGVWQQAYSANPVVNALVKYSVGF